jgi:hypothetical protein
MIIPKTEKKSIRFVISGKLLEAIYLEANKKEFEPIYYTRLILSKHFKIPTNDKSIQSGEPK